MLQKAQLPNDIQELKKMIADLQAECDLKEKKLNNEKFKYLALEEKFQILQQRFFGRKSEKLSDEEFGQMYLFNEAEQSCDSSEVEIKEEAEFVSVKPHIRKKKRK